MQMSHQLKSGPRRMWNSTWRRFGSSYSTAWSCKRDLVSCPSGRGEERAKPTVCRHAASVNAKATRVMDGILQSAFSDGESAISDTWSGLAKQTVHRSSTKHLASSALSWIKINKEAKFRKLTWLVVLGKAKVISYKDLDEAQTKRSVMEKTTLGKIKGK
ncbi:hypothetical protein BU23DRAFT_658957 [Bimuria novae-zelandiae CBS 107.79]|uniref:Uncharacterized protein n=1 Tax=Bimuria novae-zelandiae CBS 107.79 TaxID=1447943 RepID=A0A6A5UT46_9PLEO|nr:hypothetical protein BU23DRAFT_658957 [Bimuria novae-zelandiae CBS 107.79]